MGLAAAKSGPTDAGLVQSCSNQCTLCPWKEMLKAVMGMCPAEGLLCSKGCIAYMETGAWREKAESLMGHRVVLCLPYNRCQH